jgi:hypothetical protein
MRAKYLRHYCEVDRAVEDALPYIALFAGLFFFVLPIFLLLRYRKLTKKAEFLENENTALRDEMRGIVRRLYALEKAREALSPETEVGRTVVAEIVSPAQTATSDTIFVDERISEQSMESPASIAPDPTEPSTIESPLTFQAPPRESRTSQHIPSFTATPAVAGLESETRRWADLEERVGANWLNKIGTAAFVIGVALLLNYSMHYLGPQGKIALGYVLSAGFLMAGILGEKKERYRIASRAVLGGGWALAYFTTYAMHNIAAVRLIVNPIVGFVLLFLVAVAMVAHSLRYDSQVTTGFAYLLAFTSVAVSKIPIGALIASALLATSLVIILSVRRWYVLEPFAIIATYLVHLRWIDQIYQTLGGHKPFPEFTASAALLSIYWLIYLISFFLRSEEGIEETRLLAASFLLNALGYFTVLHYQAFHPEWRFWFLMIAGAVYLGVSAYSRVVGRRWGFLLASTLGAALIVAAVPYRYSGRGLEIFWLIEAEALLIAGWRVADSYLRKLGWAATGVLAAYVFWHDLSARFDVWQPPNAKLGWMLLTLAISFYLNSRLKSRLGQTATQVDDVAGIVSPVIATVFLLSAAWVSLPYVWVGLAWTALAVLLVKVGQRVDDRIWSLCGHATAAFALLRLIMINMTATVQWHNISVRLVTVVLSSVLLYLFAGASNDSKRVDETSPALESLSNSISNIGGLTSVYTAAATLLAAFLMWNVAATAAISLGWGLFGLTLLELAIPFPDRHLKIQGWLLLVASFARIFIADLASTAHLGRIPVPVLTVSLLAFVYYFAGYNTEDSPRVRVALLWFGTVSIAALLRFQLPLEWVAVGWAIVTVILYVLGRRFALTFITQSYAMAIFAGIRCAFDNFYQLGAWHFTTVRTATVSAAALLLYVLFVVTQYAKHNRSPEPPEATVTPEQWKNVLGIWSLIETHPEHLFFFVPTILLTVLLSLEVRRGFLTAAWGLEALIVFLAVMKLDERTYRWFSLLLLLLCVGRIVTVDVWTLDALGRIVSFMALGAALLGVSFLYARHRETFRRVL